MNPEERACSRPEGPDCKYMKTLNTGLLCVHAECIKRLPDMSERERTGSIHISHPNHDIPRNDV